MNNYKIYRKDNYITVINADTLETFYGHIKDVMIDKSNTNKGVYRFFNIKDFKDGTSLTIDQLLKEDDSNYTIVEFDTFYTQNTGNFNGGGAAPTGVQSVSGSAVDNTDPQNPAINTPSLQEVTDVGGTSTNPISITVAGQTALSNYSDVGYGIYNQSYSSIGSYSLSETGTGSVSQTTLGRASVHEIVGGGNTNNISEFKKNAANQAVITHDGKVVANQHVKTGAATTNILLAGGGDVATIPQSQVTNLASDLAGKESTSNKNVNSGYAGLDGTGKINPSQLPALALTDTFAVNSQAAMLALSAQTGDVAIRSDINKTFILRVNDPTILSNWSEILTPTSAVTSVFSRVGAITAQSNDYTADQIAETASRVFVTPTQKTVLSNTSGANTGDNAVNSLYSGLATSKQDVLGFTPENISNKSATLTASATLYPNNDAVIAGLATKQASGTYLTTVPTLQEVTTAGATSNVPITVTTTSTIPLSGVSSSNTGVAGTSTSGTGVVATSSSSFGIFASSTSGVAARFNTPSGNSQNIAVFQNASTNQVTISMIGRVTANSFLKSGGTSSEFLKADGTVDTTAYLNKAGDTITGDIGNTSTGFFRIPSGTTAQRPGTPLEGMRRYNTTTLRDEFYANGSWQNHVRLSGDTFSNLMTFLSGTLGLRNVANTFTSFFTNSNTASRTYTLPDISGTVALLDSPSFTGTPTAPTATAGTNTTQLATTAFVLANASPSIPHLEYNNTDKTIWNNGKGNIATNASYGEKSLMSNTTGTFNTAVGGNSLYSNTTGTFNTANGYSALYSNTTGGVNTANGYSALYSNTAGTLNTAVGGNSLYSNTTGSNNTSTGVDTLLLNTTGNDNTAYGAGSLRSLSSGSSNTALGYESGKRNTSNDDLTTANNSVFLGSITKALANNQSNQIVIGYNATGAGSNTATLGNTSITTTILRGIVQGGSFVKDSGTPTQFLKADGSVDTTIYAPLNSPTLTGIPNAPTATAGTNTTQIATTAFVLANALTPDATSNVKGKVKLAGDLGGTADLPTVPGLANKANLDSPALSGTPTAPTATAGTNTTQIATTEFVQNADAGNVKLTGTQTVTGLKTFSNTGSGQQFILSNTGTGQGVYAVSANGGTGVYSVASGSNFSNAIIATSSGNSKALNITNTGTASGSLFTNNGVGDNLVLNNTTAASGIPFSIKKNNIDKFNIYESGLAKYALDLSASYDDRTLVDKGYVTTNTTPSITHLEFNNTDKTIWNNGKSNITTNLSYGEGALFSNTTGFENTAIGYYALSNNPTGKLNTAIGYAALFSGTTGDENTAVGEYSGSYTLGNYNTSLGSYTLNTNSSTSSSNTSTLNITIGSKAGRYLTTGSGNIILSSSSDVIGGISSALTTGSNNVIINPNDNLTGSGITTGSGNVIIGRVTGLSGSLANTVVIADGVGIQRIVSNASNLTTLPAQTNALITADGTGKSIITKEYLVSVAPFKGTYSTTATATTTFTVPIGQTMADTNYVAIPVARNTLSAVMFSIQNKTTTTFDIVVTTGLTGAVSYDFTITP